MSREQQTDVVIDGRTFQIKKFTPDIGCYWIFKFLGQNPDMDEKTNMQSRILKFMAMARPEFEEFRKDCLQFVAEYLPAGPVPIIKSTGEYQVKMDIQGALQLILQSFAFSLSDFLEEGSTDGQSGPSVAESQTTTPSTISSTSQLGMDIGSNTNFGTAPTP